jgi:hypothetical protein
LRAQREFFALLIFVESSSSPLSLALMSFIQEPSDLHEDQSNFAYKMYTFEYCHFVFN